MVVMGALGWGMTQLKIPLGPAVLGIVLGGALEERFVQVSGNGQPWWDAFLGRPIAAILAVVMVVILLVPFVNGQRERRVRR